MVPRQTGNTGENFPEGTSASETLPPQSSSSPCLLLAWSWPSPAWPGDTIVQYQLKVWVRGAEASRGETHWGIFSDAYVPSQAAFSELWTMCSFCPQLFQPPVHSLCICCHTGHPGWQATMGTHCAPLMKHGLVIWGCREPAGARGEQKGTPSFYSRLFLRERTIGPSFTSHSSYGCASKNGTSSMSKPLEIGALRG